MKSQHVHPADGDSLSALRAAPRLKRRATGRYELPARLSQATLTPWFDGSVKPARSGVYQREWPVSVMFAEWTGYQWMRAAYTAAAAKRQTEISFQQPDGGNGTVRWRGLAQKP
jgi:hypothetical protein